MRRTQRLSKLGFRVTPRARIDGTFVLSSADRVGTTPEQLDILRRGRILWELRLDPRVVG